MHKARPVISEVAGAVPLLSLASLAIAALRCLPAGAILPPRPVALLELAAAPARAGIVAPRAGEQRILFAILSGQVLHDGGGGPPLAQLLGHIVHIRAHVIEERPVTAHR